MSIIEPKEATPLETQASAKQSNNEESAKPAEAKKPLDLGAKLKMGLFGKKAEEKPPSPKQDQPVRVPED